MQMWLKGVWSIYCFLSRSENRHQQLLWRCQAAKVDKTNDMLDATSTGWGKAYTEEMATKNTDTNNIVYSLKIRQCPGLLFILTYRSQKWIAFFLWSTREHIKCLRLVTKKDEHKIPALNTYQMHLVDCQISQKKSITDDLRSLFVFLMHCLYNKRNQKGPWRVQTSAKDNSSLFYDMQLCNHNNHFIYVWI